MPIRALIDALPSGHAASLWFDTCLSAAVEVSRPGTSVFSASPLRVATSGLKTLISKALVAVIERGAGDQRRFDTNCDGQLSDHEVFNAVLVEVPAYGDLPARPKLRGAWSPIPLFDVASADCNGAAGLTELGARFPALDPILRQEAAYRSRSEASWQAPPVVWVTRAENLPEWLGRPAHFVRVDSEEDVALVADMVSVAATWELVVDANRIAIIDAKDKQRELPELWTGSNTPGALPLDRQLELQLLMQPFRNEHCDGCVRRRYPRPATPEERSDLRSNEFTACSCLAATGHCYCKYSRQGERRIR